MDVPIKTNWKTGHRRKGRRETWRERGRRKREEGRGRREREGGRENISVNINMAESQAATEFLDGSDRK